MASIEERKKILNNNSFKVKVPYSASLDFPLDLAIEKLRNLYDNNKSLIAKIDLINTPIDLEKLLYNEDISLMVERDFSKDFKKALDREKLVEKESIEDLDDLCPPADINFTNNDLKNIISCPLPEPEDEKIDIDLENIKNQINKQDQLENNKKKLEQCLSDIEKITNKINNLISLKNESSTIEFELEESYWFYNILIIYYEEKQKEIKKYLGIFHPLIEKRDRLKREIEERSIPINSEKHRELERVIEEINIEKNNPGNTFKSELNSIELNEKIIDLFSNINFNKIKDKIKLFASEERIEITNSDNKNIKDFSFNFIFKIGSPEFSLYRSRDKSLDYSVFNSSDNIIAGEFEKNIDLMLMDTDNIKIENKSDDIPSGILYDRLYNIMGNPNELFSDEERGSDKKTPPNIINQKVYENFWKNYNNRFEEKKEKIIDNIINPAYRKILDEFILLAKTEARYELAYGKVWKFQIDDPKAHKLKDIVSKVEGDIKRIKNIYQPFYRSLDIIKKYNSRLDELIEIEKNNYNNVECAGDNPIEKINTSDPGGDPLGKNSLVNGIDINNPDPSKFCYWLEFSKLATLVNILPIPNNLPAPPNFFRYWPVGLIVPTPAGVYNIPLPIIWIPLVCIPTPLGIFVIFIGQCGILPCPFVLWNSPDGKHEFIISLRGRKKIESISKINSANIPSLNLSLADIKLTQNYINDIDIEGFNPIEDPNSKNGILSEIISRISKKIDKLENPDFSEISIISQRERENNIRSKLKINTLPDFTISQKINAIKKSSENLLNKLDMGEICFPKNDSSNNPKRGILNTILDLIKKPIDLGIPEIEIDPNKKINLKNKLIDSIGNNQKLSERINDLNNLDKEEKNKKIEGIKKLLRDISLGEIEGIKNPEVLGMISQISMGLSINFLNPFNCGKNTGSGKIPEIPGNILLGLNILSSYIPNIIDSINYNSINNKDLRSFFISILERDLPPIEVPNPSNISLKNFLVDIGSKIALLDKPNISNPNPLQTNICIPGSLLKNIILSSILNNASSSINKIIIEDNNIPNDKINTILNKCDDTEELSDISSDIKINDGIIPTKNLLKLNNINPSDIKRIIRDSFNEKIPDIIDKLSPIITPILGINDIKDLDFFGDPIIELNKGYSIFFNNDRFNIALDKLAGLSIIPYPAVALLGESARLLHPISKVDNLPPWERLSLSNPLFVVFLDQFCQTAKRGGGFKEGTFFPAPG